jgi:inosine-uridine nucleoside N-ribohydrolase
MSAQASLVALTAILRPEVITTREACADIELRGSLTRGRTVAWEPDDHHSMSAGLELPVVRRVRIADGVDNDSFVPFLLDRLTA